MKNVIQIINVVTAIALFVLSAWFAVEAFQYRAWMFVAIGAFGMLTSGKYLESRVA